MATVINMWMEDDARYSSRSNNVLAVNIEIAQSHWVFEFLVFVSDGGNQSSEKKMDFEELYIHSESGLSDFSMPVNKKTSQKPKSDLKSKRAPGPYALFVSSMRKNYRGSFTQFSKCCAATWRQLPESEKEKFRKKAKKQQKKRSRKHEPKSLAFLQFVNRTYECLRRKHPEWASKKIREQLMKNYQKIKCKCTKNRCKSRCSVSVARPFSIVKQKSRKYCRSSGSLASEVYYRLRPRRFCLNEPVEYKAVKYQYFPMALPPIVIVRLMMMTGETNRSVTGGQTATFA
ncbi:hypothetical protein CSKR_109072, partial [Clonorchis sinensis]